MANSGVRYSEAFRLAAVERMKRPVPHPFAAFANGRETINLNRHDSNGVLGNILMLAKNLARCAIAGAGSAVYASTASPSPGARKRLASSPCWRV